MHDRCAVIRRHEIQLTDGVAQFAAHAFGVCRTRCEDDRQEPGALAVDSEGLRRRHRQQHLRNGGGKFAQARHILVDAIAKTLVSDVNERNGAGPVDDIGERTPVIDCQVLAGWIVAAAMYKQEIIRLHGLQVCEHAVEIGSRSLLVVIAV
jgi:hypothetical protein